MRRAGVDARGDQPRIYGGGQCASVRTLEGARGLGCSRARPTSNEQGRAAHCFFERNGSIGSHVGFELAHSTSPGKIDLLECAGVDIEDEAPDLDLKEGWLLGESSSGLANIVRWIVK